MQVIAEVLLGLVIAIVIVPALIGATIMGCFGRGAAREEERK